MASRQRVIYRRARQGRTDYRRRLSHLKGGQARLIVRKSVNNIVVSLATYHADGDKVLINVHTKELTKQGWKHSTGTIPAAYLAGYLAGKKAIAAGVSNAVLDIGTQAPIHGGRVFAALKGAIDAGMTIPHSEEALPRDERIRGAHISDAIAKDIESMK